MRKREERIAREMANKDRYRPSRGVPEPCVVPRGEGTMCTIYNRESHEFPTWGVPPQRDSGRHVGFGRGEFARCLFTSVQHEYGENDRTFRSQRSYEPQSPPCGMCRGQP
jgi:hypothetical protein